MRIMMVAAENGAIPGGKVGGVGDVIRDLPLALVKEGHQVDVITPGYETLSKAADAKLELTLSVNYCGKLEQIAVFKKTVFSGEKQLNYWIFENPLFAACGEGAIYCEDHFGPYATDAQKFALLCLGVAQGIVTGALPRPDTLHLHDWHAALLLFLREFVPVYKPLQKIPTVYTIHNLSIQGVRPFANNGSSLEAWYGVTVYKKSQIVDPVARDCINMMRMGINLADKVHAVSPNYAREILLPSNPETGFVGGEGLEKDLQKVSREKRLIGILNGCEYPEINDEAKVVTKSDFVSQTNQCLLDWVGDEAYISTAYFFAQQRLLEWSGKREKESLIVASIGRLVWQKMGLLDLPGEGGKTALEVMLEKIPDSLIIMLGSGDPYYENAMSRVMTRYSNFLFLKGYSESLADTLYQYCDSFLMPSTYEPCGISQMLALRAGKPCLVHGVGGLKDTVIHEKNGLVFYGETPQQQADALINAYKNLYEIKTTQNQKWEQMKKAALESRYSWSSVVEQYLTELY